jgi:hypothetical protein
LGNITLSLYEYINIVYSVYDTHTLAEVYKSAITVQFQNSEIFQVGKDTILNGLIFCVFVMRNLKSDNSFGVGVISVKLPKFVYSQNHRLM